MSICLQGFTNGIYLENDCTEFFLVILVFFVVQFQQISLEVIVYILEKVFTFHVCICNAVYLFLFVISISGMPFPSELDLRFKIYLYLRFSEHPAYISNINYRRGDF